MFGLYVLVGVPEITHLTHLMINVVYLILIRMAKIFAIRPLPLTKLKQHDLFPLWCLGCRYLNEESQLTPRTRIPWPLGHEMVSDVLTNKLIRWMQRSRAH